MFPAVQRFDCESVEKPGSNLFWLDFITRTAYTLPHSNILGDADGET